MSAAARRRTYGVLVGSGRADAMTYQSSIGMV
jgi:hypothetical protein